MRVKEIQRGNRRIRIYILEDHLDGRNHQLIPVVQKAVSERVEIIIDLKGLRSISSAGINKLLEARDVCAHGGQLFKIVARGPMECTIKEFDPNEKRRPIFYRDRETACDSFIES